MNPEIDKMRQPLSSEARERIFKEKILPSILTGSLPATNKTFAAVCSQPGAGKSTVVQRQKNRFGNERTISISIDDFFNYLPGLNEARMNGAFWGSQLKHENATVNKWRDDSMKYALRNEAHIIMETTNDPQSDAEELFDKGYKNREIYIIATDRHTSLTSVFLRAVHGFENGTMANCAVMGQEDHDENYSKWPKIAFAVEKTGSFNRIAVVTRDLGLCYQNEVILHTPSKLLWEKDCGAARQVIEMNNRHFTQSRIDQLKEAWGKIITAPLAELPEFQRYPLKKYADDVISHAESLGGRYDPDIVLPQDREAGRDSYLNLLDKHLQLIDKDLDLDYVGEQAFMNHLGEIYGVIKDRTRLKLDVGNEMRRDIDARVAREKSQEAIQRSALSLPRRRLSRDSGYGSSHPPDFPAAQGNAQTQGALKPPAATGERLPVKRLRSREEYIGGSERLPHDVTLQHSEREQEAGEALIALGGGRPAKRARYEERPRDGGRA